MKNLIYIVFGLFAASSILVFIDQSFAVRIKFMEMLGVGLVYIKFANDYYVNRKSHSGYLKYAIYSALSFLVFIGALILNARGIPYVFINALLMLSLLVFSMIGLNSSLAQYQSTEEKRVKNTSLLYLIIFAIHGLAAFITATAFLKQMNILIIIPIILGIDLLILVPYVIVKKAYHQFLLMALIAVSLSINSFLLFRTREYSPIKRAVPTQLSSEQKLIKHAISFDHQKPCNPVK